MGGVEAALPGSIGRISQHSRRYLILWDPEKYRGSFQLLSTEEGLKL